MARSLIKPPTQPAKPLKLTQSKILSLLYESSSFNSSQMSEMTEAQKDMVQSVANSNQVKSPT